MLEIVRYQNDREIDVFLDKRGNHGKSWISNFLFERGKALIVPRAEVSASRISAFVCSAYHGEPYIIMDIPRSTKPQPGLYESLEELKDGLVFDGRYSGRTRNIRGVKLIVFTNLELDKKRLSTDRWRLHGVSETQLLIDLLKIKDKIAQEKGEKHKKFQSNSKRNIRQTNVDKTEDTDLYRTAKEVTKWHTEDTQEGATEGATAEGATTDAETGAITEVVT